MGLEDRDSLRVLHAAFDPANGAEVLTRRFYNQWFDSDTEVRDLFPPDLDAQRDAFALAMHWVLGELVAQRAHEPVALLAQLGRDHRKYGVRQEHYASLRQAWLLTMRSCLSEVWDDDVDHAAVDAITLITEIMAGAADADGDPPWWDGTVVEHRRVSRDLAVIRLRLEEPLPYLPGQYVKVQTPQCPRRWRFLSPAAPPGPDGTVVFHVRAVSGGMVSTAMVGETRPGDRWRLSGPLGALEVDRSGGDVLMVAGSTGLAPLRALIMDMVSRESNPQVHLFFGARYPCELYDLRMLWTIAVTSPWLTITPVSEYRFDPPWATDYPDPKPKTGLLTIQTGRLPDIVTEFGPWDDRQAFVCGGPGMIAATRDALIAKGTAAERIHCDPQVAG